MKNIDWEFALAVVFCVVVVVAMFGCVFAPLLIRAAKDMWLWALA